MTTATSETLFTFLRRAAGVDRVQTDEALLQRFCASRDDDAFTALVRRHGPMVFTVCRRVLHGRPEVDDAFQATFLVLARKAEAIARPAQLAAWLHGVAYRTALKARGDLGRRESREQPVQRLPDQAAPEWSPLDWHAVLDEEITRLPDKYRVPVLLCYLRGHTNEEAARALGCPKGTIQSRLAEARERLRGRLQRRGVTLSVAVLVATLRHSKAAPPALIEACTHVCGSAALAEPAARLAEEVLRMTGYTKLKAIAAGLVVAALLWLTMGMFTSPDAASSAPALLAGEKPRPEDKAAPRAGGKKDKIIPDDVQKAIEAGLEFLADSQAEDGSWPQAGHGRHVGVTSLAGLAFLASDVTPGQKGRGQVVEKAIRFILSRQEAAAPGLFKETAGAVMYSQGFATSFLAQALPRMEDSDLKKQVKKALEAAVEVILKAQNRAGGWRYSPMPLDADLTVTSTQLHALSAAKKAGIKVPDAALDRAAAFIVSCQSGDDGGFRYMPVAGATSLTRTAVAVSALLTSGKDAQGTKKGIAHLKNAGPDKTLGSAVKVHLYYDRYYTAQASWKAGDDKEAWARALQKDLLSHFAGTRWRDASLGDHYATAMAILALQAPRAK